MTALARRRARARTARSSGRTPAFPPFFRSFTPVDELALLEIGSRPVSRPEAAGRGELEALRAIPWVFAWTQNRCLLPAWYGCGTAFADYGVEGERLEWLRRLYRELAVLPRARREPRDDAREVELRDRARLSRPRAAERRPRPDLGARSPTSIGARSRRCSRSSRREALLDRHPVVQRSVRLRNPYVDPMNAIQVELLARAPSGRRARRSGRCCARSPASPRPAQHGLSLRTRVPSFEGWRNGAE